MLYGFLEYLILPSGIPESKNLIQFLRRGFDFEQ